MPSYLTGFGIIIAVLLYWRGAAWYNGHRFKKWWTHGQAALERDDFTAAEAALRQCARLAPTLSVVHRVLGSVLARRGKLKEAEEHFRLGAELEPRNPAGFVDLGFFLALCHSNRGDEAVDAFSKAIGNAPELREKLRDDARLAPLHHQGSWRQLMQ